MPSALLFILLGVMWAVVLIPMWLRKHDEADETRSVDRFSRALGSLSRRLDRSADQETVIVREGKVPAGREVLMPGRPAGARGVQVSVSGAPARVSRTQATAEVRRRRLLLGLLLVTGAVLVLGLTHRLPLWVAAVPAVAVLGLLVHGRRQSAHRTEMARRRQRRNALSAAARAAEDRYAGETPARRPGRIAEPVAAAPGIELEADLPGTPAPVEESGSWHAVPTTLPTYVTAPPATAVPRVIDRTTPGAWSGAAMIDQARRTRQVEPDDDSGMRVESFEICVPRPPSAGEVFADRYVDPSAGTEELAAAEDDEAALEALLADPRTGVDGSRRYRRAAG